MDLFIPLTKVDASRREVWGVAAIEQPDRSREIMDYELSKPNFMKWSESIHKASGGKSLGNVRASHSTDAVGKVIALEPDDVTKAFRVGVKVVDDNAWRKVQEGVFTGFSIGGSYGKRAPDGFLKDHIRYEAIPTELSLVDVPCIPDAQFEFIKANGESEMKKVMTEEEKNKFAAEMAAKKDVATEVETPAEDKGENPADEGTANDTSDTSASKTETGKIETETNSEAGVSPEGQGLTADGVKEIVIGLLMELGLVQQQGSTMMMSAKISDMAKATDQQLILSKAHEEFKAQIVGDMAKIAVAIDGLEKRGSGPVLREVAPITPQMQADTQRADLFKKMASETSDPNVRQSLLNEAARLEIKKIQNT
ncbi:MAG: hypothetical protein NTW69_06320 [Chloroflexi bacterium]|nr:hypothetical protein [Chloroflexota bacterium]